MTPDETVYLLLDRRPDLVERLKERLYARRTVTSSSCWISTDNISGKGYARVSIYFDNVKHRIRSHRFSYILSKGYIPEDSMILHSCDNPLCWNPDHLFLGDAKANQQDRISKGRLHDMAAKLTASQVIEIRARFVKGETRKDLAAYFGVHYTTIRDIINGRYHGAKPPA